MRGRPNAGHSYNGIAGRLRMTKGNPLAEQWPPRWGGHSLFTAGRSVSPRTCRRGRGCGQKRPAVVRISSAPASKKLRIPQQERSDMTIRSPVPAYTARRPCAPFSAGCLPSPPAERGLFIPFTFCVDISLSSKTLCRFNGNRLRKDRIEFLCYGVLLLVFV